ncbi:MAG: hypothetical protein WD595_00895 [Waddliaceae bacterium]
MAKGNNGNNGSNTAIVAILVIFILILFVIFVGIGPFGPFTQRNGDSVQQTELNIDAPESPDFGNGRGSNGRGNSR